MQSFSVKGNIVDIDNQQIFYGLVTVANGKIVTITTVNTETKIGEDYITWFYR